MQRLWVGSSEEFVEFGFSSHSTSSARTGGGEVKGALFGSRICCNQPTCRRLRFRKLVSSLWEKPRQLFGFGAAQTTLDLYDTSVRGVRGGSACQESGGSTRHRAPEHATFIFVVPSRRNHSATIKILLCVRACASATCLAMEVSRVHGAWALFRRDISLVSKKATATRASPVVVCFCFSIRYLLIRPIVPASISVVVWTRKRVVSSLACLSCVLYLARSL